MELTTITVFKEDLTEFNRQKLGKSMEVGKILKSHEFMHIIIEERKKR